MSAYVIISPSVSVGSVDYNWGGIIYDPTLNAGQSSGGGGGGSPSQNDSTLVQGDGFQKNIGYTSPSYVYEPPAYSYQSVAGVKSLIHFNENTSAYPGYYPKDETGRIWSGIDEDMLSTPAKFGAKGLSEDAGLTLYGNGVERHFFYSGSSADFNLGYGNFFIGAFGVMSSSWWPELLGSIDAIMIWNLWFNDGSGAESHSGKITDFDGPMRLSWSMMEDNGNNSIILSYNLSASDFDNQYHFFGFERVGNVFNLYFDNTIVATETVDDGTTLYYRANNSLEYWYYYVPYD